MTESNITARTATEINAPAHRVWEALTDPQQIKQYMFGSDVTTDWKPGSPITWTGEYEGRSFEDRGEILEVEPERRLEMTHFSPLSGAEDVPANYHTLIYELHSQGDRTVVSLSQDGNKSDEEAERARSNWEQMLAGLKQVVEAE